jgi:hypothetical protein
LSRWELAEVLIRIVRVWPYDNHLAAMPFSHFDGLDGGVVEHPPDGNGAASAARLSRMRDIDE